MADFDEVKTIIRSVLISTPRMLTVSDLAREYRLMDGGECPFVRLGYRSFESFLRSIPDTVTVLGNGFVRAVLTQQTAHIQHLVSLQKRSKNSRRRPPGNYKSNSYRAPAPRFYSSASSRPASSYSYSTTVRPSSAMSSVSSKRDACSSSSSSKTDRCTSSSFSKMDPVPSSSSKRDPIPSSSIEEHFQKVREAKENARRDALGLQPTGETLSPVDAGWSGEAFIREWQKSHPSEDASSPRRVIRIPERLSSDDDSDDSFFERFREDEDGLTEATRVTKVESPPVSPSPSERINGKIKSNIKELLRGSPRGIWARQLPEQYREKYGVGLNWMELGYASVVQMAHDLLDILVIERDNNGDWMLFCAGTETSSGCGDTPVSVPEVSDSVKRKIYDIVRRYKSGLRVEQLVQLYSEAYGRSLSSDAPGFKSAVSLFTSLQDTVVHVRPIRSEYYIYPGQQPPPAEDFPSLVIDKSASKELGLYPEEVMNPGEVFPPMVLPSGLKPGDYIEIKVAEIYNPHKFWVLTVEGAVQLDRLMDELQDFYQDHGIKYSIPAAALVEGLCCTALYSNEWHRAVIKSTAISEKIEVDYIDYGTVGHVESKSLRFLHRDFSILPSQAIRASLCGIQPPSGKPRFSKEANRKLLELVHNKALIGCVQSFEPKEPFLELFLVDTNSEIDVHINDVLVNLKLAAFKPDLIDSLELDNLDISGVACAESNEPHKTSALPDSHLKLGTPPPPAPSASAQVPQVHPTGQPVGAVGNSSATNSVVELGHVPLSTPSAAQLLNQRQPDITAAPLSGTSVPPGFSYLGNQIGNQMGLGAVGSGGSNPFLQTQSLPAALMNAAFLQQYLQYQQYILSQYQSLVQQSATTLLAAQASPVTSVSKEGNSSLWNTGSNMSAQSHNQEAPLRTPNVWTDIAADVTKTEKTESKQAQEQAAKEEAHEKSSSVDYSDMSDIIDDQASRKKKKILKKRSRKGQSKPGTAGGSNCEDTDEDAVPLPQTDSEESSRTLAPDLVLSVANMHISHHGTSSNTSFWKAVEVAEKKIYLFNIESKLFVSTGELARKFAGFSTYSSLKKVLDCKDISIPFKVLTRREYLSFFAALDEFPEDVVKTFDLSKNSMGSVIGSFHLTPLVNVPSVLIPVGTSIAVVKGFQKLRDLCSISDNGWTM